MSRSRIVDRPGRIRLLEMPGKVSGEPVKVRVLEPAESDPRALYQQIMNGDYDRPFIIDDGETRQLLFSLDFIQSAMRIDDPFALEFDYTRKMMAFLLFVPNPSHVLMVGLGGGSLAKFCHRHLPRTRLTVLEVNADVIALRGEFEVPEDERLAIIQADAVEYLPAAEGDADVLLLDGFDASGIAAAFLDRDFYQSARRRLKPAGVLVANFAGPRGGWKQHWALLNEVFEKRVLLGRVPGGDNHVALAFADEGYPPDWARLEELAESLACQFPIDFHALVSSLRKGTGRRTKSPRPLKSTTPQPTGDPDMQSILKYMSGRGEQLDADIAAATRIPLEELRPQLSELSSKGDIIMCHSTRFINGKKVEGMLCRVAGITPSASPGRKPKAKM